MRLGDPILPVSPESEYDKALNRRLYDFLRVLVAQVNALSAEDNVANNRTGTAAPTTGSFAVGDRVRNSAPTELGAAASKYVILGWICTASGTPGTWKEMRTLTGN